MFEFVKKRAFLLFVAGLAMGMAGCSDDDPDYDNVTPPQVSGSCEHIDRCNYGSKW